MITSWADEEDKANAKYDAIRGKSKKNQGGGSGSNANQGGRNNNNNNYYYYSGSNRKRKPDNTAACSPRCCLAMSSPCRHVQVGFRGNRQPVRWLGSSG
jgi:hypothetical protein